MHLRSFRIAHVLALAVIAVLTPSCASSKKLAAPNVQATVPVMLSGPAVVGRSPLLVLQFDREMDPTTINTANILITETVSGNSFPVSSLEYNTTLNEVRIIPGGLLSPGLSYNVFATANVTSSAGTQMGSAEGITVTVSDPIQMVASFTWSNPTFTVTPNATVNTEIDVSWLNNAMETINPTTPTPLAATHYDVYVSTVSNQEDWFSNAAPLFFTNSGSPMAITGLTPNTTYYMKIVPRDDENSILQTPPEVTATTNP